MSTVSREDGGERGELAPVIPLFEPREPATRGPEMWHPTWTGDPAGEEVTRSAALESALDSDLVERLEKALLKKLRGRSLSISEARDFLTREGADAEVTYEIVARFVSRGYLDDAALAEQLIHIGVDRKGQGRRVIAQTLTSRGIPRDVADHALLALPDDDRERALEFARGKARALSSVDSDTALRRLAGQLARRGYGGSLAFDVAREALGDGASAPRSSFSSRGSSGVRFVEN